MSDSEKVEMVKNLISDVSVTDEQITAYLGLSAERILNRMFPFGRGLNELPREHDAIQCELAVRMIARRGGEGEVSHSENGISRTWGSVDDSDILQRITPYVRVL